MLNSNKPFLPQSCKDGATLRDGSCYIKPSCPEGTSFNSRTAKCEGTPTPICINKTIYDDTFGGCVVVPNKCPFGMTFDSNTNLCSGSVDQKCPTGTIMSNGICVVPDAQRICPQGKVLGPTNTFNDSNNRTNCYSCDPGYTSAVLTDNGYQCIVKRPYNAATQTFSACPNGSVPDSSNRYCYGPPIKYSN